MTQQAQDPAATMEPFAIAPLTPADRDDVLAFAQDLSEHDILFLARDVRVPKVMDAWLAAIADGSIESLVARRDGKVCAMAALVRDPLGWSPHLADVRIVAGEEARGRGLGRRMLEEILAIGVGNGTEKFMARMTPDQRGAIALFESIGFRGEAMLRDHVRDAQGDLHDLVIMSLHLAEYERLRDAYGTKE